LRPKILDTAGLILLWVSIVIAVMSVQAIWFAHPSVQRGDFKSIENYLVQRLNAVAERKRLGSAAVRHRLEELLRVLIQNGKIIAEHSFGVAVIFCPSPLNADRPQHLKAVQTVGLLNNYD
jgi:hypothetical protein